MLVIWILVVVARDADGRELSSAMRQRAWKWHWSQGMRSGIDGGLARQELFRRAFSRARAHSSRVESE